MMRKSTVIISIVLCSFVALYAMDNGQCGNCDADWSFNIAGSPTSYLLKRLRELDSYERSAQFEIKCDRRTLVKKVRDAMHPHSPKCHADGAFHVWAAQALCHRCEEQRKKIEHVLQQRWEQSQVGPCLLDSQSREEQVSLNCWHDELSQRKCACIPHSPSSRCRSQSLPVGGATKESAPSVEISVSRPGRSKSLSGGNYVGLTFPPKNESLSNK